MPSLVVQMDDYYPFGLTFNSYQRERTVSKKGDCPPGQLRKPHLHVQVGIDKKASGKPRPNLGDSHDFKAKYIEKIVQF